MSNTFKSTSYGQQEANRETPTPNTPNAPTASGDRSEKIINLSSSNRDNRDKKEMNRSNETSGSKMDFEGLETKIEDYGAHLKERGLQLSRQMTSRVKNNPWAFIGGASVAGVVVGYLLGRRTS